MNKKRGNRFSIEYQIKKYGITEKKAINKIEKLKSNVGGSNVYSTKWQMNKYNLSKNEAVLKIQSIKDKIKLKQKELSNFDYKAMSPKNTEHWIKRGLNKIDAQIAAKNQIKDMQQAYQRQYKETPEKYNGSFNTQLKYYLKKTNGNIEKSQELLTNRQNTNNLKTYINKYGDSGYDKWKKRNKDWSILMEKKYKDGDYEKIIHFISSKIEREFINNLLEKIPNIKYKKQFRLYDNKNKYYVYDVLINNKVIIEFNGDFWHANPKIYNKDWIHPFINESAETIWRHENIKLELLKDYDYEYLIIWESDYKNNKIKTIDKLAKKLYESNYI